MVSRSAITKVKALFIIDVIIVAIAAGIYLYLWNTGELAFAVSKPAEFTVTDLTISSLEAGLGEPILISANVTNVGEEEGSYSLNLTINDVMKETKTILLSGGNFSIVEFTDIENAEGNYFVEIGGLNGTFTITSMPPPSTLRISDLITSEGWVNENITISVKVSNTGNEPISYSLAFKVNDVIRGTKTIKLSAGETQTVNCTVTESSEGTYSVNVGGLRGSFIIVPTGKHTLQILAANLLHPLGFTLNGVDYTTPYLELLPAAEYSIKVPDTINTETALLQFLHWENGETSAARTISLQRRMELVATYRIVSGYLTASCPSLFTWNGTSYVYIADISSRGYLGYINYIKGGRSVYWCPLPWDYVKLDKSQLQSRNGCYDLMVTERYDEIFYLDEAYMLVVDHPSNVDVYTTMGEQYIDPNFMHKIYTVGKNPLTPISAFNEKGEDVLSQISKLDGIFTSVHNGIYSESIYNISWNRLTLNLGNLTGAKQIKLIVNGILDWGPDEDIAKWHKRFWTQQVPNGTQPVPPPYMEVKDANGNWVRVPESRQFPLLPDGKPRTIVVDLTGLFPTNDYSLRINNFWNVTFNYIGVDTTSQENVTIQRIDPAFASLYQGFNTNSDAAGNFTRYGDVTQLVLNADDKFVIGTTGDKVSLQFPANIVRPTENMERDFFLIDSIWFRESGNPRVTFTVDPLPFNAMSNFPYPPTESYPYDEDHLSYLREYNTRTLPIPRAQWIVGDILRGTIVTGLWLAGILTILIWIKERARRGRLLRIKSTIGQ